MERAVNDKELIGYLKSVIGVCEQIIESGGLLETQVCGNGPTARQLIARAKRAAQTNRLEL